MHHRSAALVLSLVLVACGAEAPPADPPEAPAEEAAAVEPLPEGTQARSLLGEALFAPAQSDEVRATYQANLDAAERGFEAAPENADSIIWYGRRLAYLGRYDEAIEVYARGIELHPGDARLYRHRGHRYLSTRRLDEAIADFREAAELIEGTEDRVEPDGLPNALGVPTSTLHFNIWYHLGLAHYVKGEFEEALLAWNECLAVSDHVDSVVATTYWLNNTLRRLGLEERADALLGDISGGMEIIEVQSYLDVLLLHKGERTAEDLLGPTGADATLGSTTTGYGVGMWHVVNGRPETAYQIWEAILTNRDQWPAFGYLAAEAEVAHSRPTGN
jgi:tetratricopeptide (TPR) repeat protein